MALTRPSAMDVQARLLSPPCEVHWGPWKSSTVHLYRAGWEFAVEMDLYHRHYLVVMRDRNTGTSAVGRAYVAELMESADRYNARGMTAYRSDPVIQVERMALSDRHYVHFESPTLVLADMNPEMHSGTYKALRGKTIDELGIFKKWAPKANEIIVEPQTVADMLEKIKRMQSGDLAEIRERNRKRDLREQRSEQVVAQIITLAA